MTAPGTIYIVVTLDEKLATLPDRPGVYLYRDAKGQALYVGKAASLRSRVRSYFQEARPRDAKTDALVRQIADLDYVVTDNELEALMLEANLVRKHRPRYNIILRDDKHYPFLKLTTNEEFPRLLVARRAQNDGATYYGPFYPATAMLDALKVIRQPLHKVRERQKIISTDEVDQDVIGVVRQGSDACVEFFFVRKGRLVGQEAFFFDRVAGWADGEILSAFVRQFYGKAVAPAPEILVSEDLPEAELTTEWLSTLAGRRVQIVVPQRGPRREFVAMAEANAAIALQNHLLSRDDRQQVVLEELRRALTLPGLPNRIEGYDISHVQGSEQVGSLVVWENGSMKKEDYKRFRIKTVAGADDF